VSRPAKIAPAGRDGPSGAGHLLLLWFGGISLRVTVLAVPPLLPRIHHDLHLDEKAVGALTSLPILLLALAAIFGSLLVSRIGPRRALIAGLTLVAIAGALRGFGSSAAILFPMTLLMGLGISVSQPAFPSLVRLWFPTRMGFGVAVYSNGQLMGEVIAAAVTAPLVLPLVGGRWPYALAAWSAGVLVIAVAFAAGTQHVPPIQSAAARRWWPDWRDAQTWRLGLIFGGASIAYFSTNAFIPDYLRATHAAAFTGAALNSINISQIPASVLIALFPGSFIGRRWPLVVVGCITVLCAAGMAMGGVWVVIWAAPLGFSTAAVLVLCLALPPLVADPSDVHRMSAAMFTITYSCSFVGSLAAGALWDATGVPFSAFIPLAVSGCAIAVLAATLNADHMRAAARAVG
jgi:CP family cyanate transporter-like MFS transporter